MKLYEKKIAQEPKAKDVFSFADTCDARGTVARWAQHYREAEIYHSKAVKLYKETIGLEPGLKTAVEPKLAQARENLEDAMTDGARTRASNRLVLATVL